MMDDTTKIMGINVRVPARNSFKKDLTILNIYASSTQGNMTNVLDIQVQPTEQIQDPRPLPDAHQAQQKGP
jgi:hypothetical protein